MLAPQRSRTIFMPHVVLLGDSVFDNGAYVGRGPDVIAQVRERLPAGSTGTLAAVDGALIGNVARQMERVPTSATHLVVSAGGRAVLSTRRATTRRTLSHAAHGRLLALVAAARIEHLRARYRPRTPVADGIDEVLTFHGRTVTVAQDAAAPRALRRALDALARLASDLARG